MQPTILLVGGTGRTGRRVLEELLSRGLSVRVVVRSARKLAAGVAGNPLLEVIEADLLSLNDDDLQQYVRGCEIIISCLGHVISFTGIFGPPRDLVTRATARLCRAAESLRPATPVRFILMGSVSVYHPDGRDTRRGTLDKAMMWIVRGLLPPAEDNQQATNFLHRHIGVTNPFVQWVVVRPDTLADGNRSEYDLHENLVNSLFAPASANLSNVAHFMCELATDLSAWNDWKGKLPVIVNATSS